MTKKPIVKGCRINYCGIVGTVVSANGSFIVLKPDVPRKEKYVGSKFKRKREKNIKIDAKHWGITVLESTP